MTVIDTICLLLLISALVGAAGFVGTYASFAPWRTNEVGRSMMLLAVAVIGLIVSGILLNALGPNYPFRSGIRIGVYSLLNVALWKQLTTLLRVLNAKSERPIDAEPIVLPIQRGLDEAEDKHSVV